MKGLVTVGLDGTLQAMAAARWAAREAELRRARLLLLHAWIPRTPGPAHASAEEETTGYAPHRITEEARAVILASHPDLAVHVRAVRKDPLDALVKAADESDLLVLGSRGLGAAARFTLGETGLELVTRTAVPTVLVRAQQAVPARIGSGNVTVGVSLHGTCDGLLAFAFETAARRAVMLRAVHGRRLSPYAYNRGGGADRIAAEEAAQIARNELAAALRPWRKKFPDVHVDAQVILESPAPALLHGTVNAELLVVGRRPGGRLLPPRIGHVVQAAVHHAPCPVAVVPFD
ncbi:universal stress protein [Streptomyces lydicus]|uniref:universal stress protein n=1 Tax=Streptomyces lydicus TaxID=47763 RepID=UPI00286FB9A9|nr:universal stress protein [Streptomyces lydicus]